MADYSQYDPSAGSGYDYPTLMSAFLAKLGVDVTAKASAVHIHDAGDPPILEAYPDGNQSATGAKHIGLNTDSNQVEVIAADGVRMVQPLRLPLLDDHPATPPPAGCIYKYAVLVSGVPEEFTMDSAGDYIQLTSGGVLMSAMDMQVVQVSFTIAQAAVAMDTHDVTVEAVEDYEHAHCSIPASSNYVGNVGVSDGTEPFGTGYGQVLGMEMVDATTLRIKFRPEGAGFNGQTIAFPVNIQAPKAA